MLTIRKMAGPDIPRVSQILTANYLFIAAPDKIPSDRMPALLEKCASVNAVTDMPNNRDCYVALSGKDVIAFLTIKGDQIGDLFVDPAQHRKGFGAEVFEFAKETIRKAGHKRLVLVTTGYGIPFYQAMGMTITGKIDITSGPLRGGKTTRLEMPLA